MDEPGENSPELSIVIGVVDAEDHIVSCLEQVYEQGLARDAFEVLVVDGGSVDETVTRARHFIESRSIENLTILHNPRRSLAAAFNVAIPACRGRFVAKLDAQGRLGPGYYRTLLPILENDRQIGLIGGRFRLAGDTPLAAAWAPLFQDPFLVGPARYRYTSHRTEIDAAVYGIYRKEAWLQVGAFDERIRRAEDTDFNLRLRKLGWKIMMEPAVGSTYHVRRGLGAAYRQFEGYAFWRSFVQRKHRLAPGLRQVVPITWMIVMVGGFVAALATRTPAFLLPHLVYGGAVVARVSRLLKGHRPAHWLAGLCLYPVLHTAYAVGTIRASVQPRGWARGEGGAPAQTR